MSRNVQDNLPIRDGNCANLLMHATRLGQKKEILFIAVYTVISDVVIVLQIEFLKINVILDSI